MALGFSPVGIAAGIMTARHAKGSFIVGGADLLSGASSEAILSFSWQDNTNDMADGISIEIADPQRTWMATYLPKKGIESEAQIKVFNWTNPGDSRTIDCGVFWVDQIECSGPPNVVSVKGTSIPVITGIKNERKFKAWEDVDLYTVASEIAAKNGLTLKWDSSQMPEKKKRIDQVEEPDLEFVQNMVYDAALSLKLYKKQMVIYSAEEYDARPAVYRLVYGNANILNYSIVSKLDDTYKSSENAYVDPETGLLVESSFEATEPPEGSGSKLKINEIEEEDDSGESSVSVGLLAEDESSDISIGSDVGSGGGNSTGKKAKKVKAKLREKNKDEKTATFTVVGEPSYMSGLNAELIGFGAYDGKWNISGTTHDIGPDGYTTTLNMRHCLNGY